jgi:hypothetical protein
VDCRRNHAVDDERGNGLHDILTDPLSQRIGIRLASEDTKEFLRLAGEIELRPKVTVFPDDQINQAPPRVKRDQIDGATVVVSGSSGRNEMKGDAGHAVG